MDDFGLAFATAWFVCEISHASITIHEACFAKSVGGKGTTSSWRGGAGEHLVEGGFAGPLMISL